MELSASASDTVAVAIAPPIQPTNFMHVKMEMRDAPVSQLDENDHDDVESTTSDADVVADDVSRAEASAPRDSVSLKALLIPLQPSAAPASASSEQPAPKPKATRIRTRQTYSAEVNELLAAVNNLKPIQKILWQRNIPCPQLTGVPKTVEFLTNLLLEMEKCIHTADLDIPQNIFSHFLVQNGMLKASASASKPTDNKASESAPSSIPAVAAASSSSPPVASTSSSSPPESAPAVDAAPSVSSNTAPKRESESSSRNLTSQISEVSEDDDLSLSAQISGTTSLVAMSFNVFKLSKLIQEDPNNSELHRLSLELTKQTHSRLAESLKKASTAPAIAAAISTSTVPVISTSSAAAAPVVTTSVASSSAPSLVPNPSSTTSTVSAPITPLSSSFVVPSAPVANGASIATKRVFSSLAPSVSQETQRRPEVRNYPLPPSQPQQRLQVDSMAIDLLGDEDSFSSQSMKEILTGSKNRWLK